MEKVEDAILDGFETVSSELPSEGRKLITGVISLVSHVSQVTIHWYRGRETALLMYTVAFDALAHPSRPILSSRLTHPGVSPFGAGRPCAAT